MFGFTRYGVSVEGVGGSAICFECLQLSRHCCLQNRIRTCPSFKRVRGLSKYIVVETTLPSVLKLHVDRAAIKVPALSWSVNRLQSSRESTWPVDTSEIVAS
jgi:hypothetical protein